MEILTLQSADVQVINKELETAVHKLCFRVTGAMPVSEETAKPDPKAHLTALLGNMEITLTKQDGFTTETLHQSLLVQHLAEISSFDSGIIYIDRSFDPAVAANNATTIEFAVDISTSSALLLDDKAKLMLNINNKVVGTVVSIEVLEHPVNGQTYVSYESKYLNANVSKDFGIESHYAAALPVEKVVAVELHYSNGKVVKLTQSELKKLVRDNQDEICVINGLVTYGYLNFATLDVRSVYKMRITLNDNTNFYLLKENKA